MISDSIASNNDLFDYQKADLNEIEKGFLSFKEVILALGCGGGKTRTSIAYINKFIETYPGEGVLVLPHSTGVLRTNFENELQKYKESRAKDDNDLAWKFVVHTPDTNFQRLFNDGNRVIVSLPQSIKATQLAGTKIGLLIVDEAHHNYQAARVKEIIKKVAPKQILLLTGSPSKLIDPKRFLVARTMTELCELEQNSPIHVELVSSCYNYQKADYLDTDQVKGAALTREFTEANHNQEIYRFLEALVNRLSLEDLRAKEGYTDKVYRKLKDYEEFGRDGYLTRIKEWFCNPKTLNKTMIACATVDQAISFKKHLKEILPEIEVFLSHSVSGKEGYEGVEAVSLEAFKSHPQTAFLLVVDRGVIGFSMPDLANVVDATGSINPNQIYQLIGRVARKSDTTPNKLFLKLASNDRLLYTKDVLGLVLKLMVDREFYITWNGDVTPIKTKAKERGRQQKPKSKTEPNPKPQVFHFPPLDQHAFFGWEEYLHKYDQPLGIYCGINTEDLTVDQFSKINVKIEKFLQIARNNPYDPKKYKKIYQAINAWDPAFVVRENLFSADSFESYHYLTNWQPKPDQFLIICDDPKCNGGFRTGNVSYFMRGSQEWQDRVCPFCRRVMHYDRYDGKYDGRSGKVYPIRP